MEGNLKRDDNDKFSDKRKKEYGECSICNKYNTTYSWCQSCDPQSLTVGWTSGNEAIDELIKSSQRKATQYHSYAFLEWIPYENLENIEKIGEGGFATVYKATWVKGFKSLDKKTKQRTSVDTEVALKRLHNSQNIADEYVKEFQNYVEFYHQLGMMRIYGMTKDPETKEYIFVMKYFKDGSLYTYLRKQFKNLKWKDKLNLLCDIITGLSSIHDRGFVHRDFHSGNILIGKGSQEGVEKVFAYICDLGLSAPIDSLKSSESGVVGVLPYIAPEVLRNEPYRPKSDMYSFGVIMSFISTGLQPFNNVEHDLNLALKICEGVRPTFSDNTPKLYIDLAYDCMNADPQKRPSANEARDLIWTWRDSLEDDLNSVCKDGRHTYSGIGIDELKSIREEYEKMDKIKYVPPRISATIHPSIVYTSRLLEKFKGLPQPINSTIIKTNDSQQIDLAITEEMQNLMQK